MAMLRALILYVALCANCEDGGNTNANGMRACSMFMHHWKLLAIIHHDWCMLSAIKFYTMPQPSREI